MSIGQTEKHVVKCPICGRPFLVVPTPGGGSNACPSCTKAAEKNSGAEPYVQGQTWY